MRDRVSPLTDEEFAAVKAKVDAGDVDEIDVAMLVEQLGAARLAIRLALPALARVGRLNPKTLTVAEFLTCQSLLGSAVIDFERLIGPSAGTPP